MINSVEQHAVSDRGVQMQSMLALSGESAFSFMARQAQALQLHTYKAESHERTPLQLVHGNSCLHKTADLLSVQQV